ncbi:MAG: N-acyl homoserine lactonase family protein [Pseudomonadota bacterium]
MDESHHSVVDNASTRNDTQAIRGIEVLNTGWAEQHREHRYGSWMPQLMWVLASRSWVKLPLQAFLIHHQSGPVLFDTGVDPALVGDPDYISQAIGRWLLRRIFRFDINKTDSLRSQLNAIGVSPGDIRKAVISHLHFDHVGGIADVPNAELLVSDQEWAQLSTPHPEHEWILREHIEIPGAKWRPITFEPTDDAVLARFGGTFDVMGDGSIMLIPTPGHTSGSLSMLVRSDGMAPVLFVGDLTYEARLIFEDRVPGTGDNKTLRQTYAKVRALKADLPDMVILASHDPSASESLQHALRP